METTSNDSKINCWLCQTIIIKPYMTPYKNSQIHLCTKCKNEYITELENLKEKSIVWVQDHINSWLIKTRSVKRVYNRQYNLFGGKS